MITGEVRKARPLKLRDANKRVLRDGGRMPADISYLGKHTTRTENIAGVSMASWIVVLTLLVLIGNTPASCAELVGRMLNNRGQPVSGVTVFVENSANLEAGKAVSDANGAYAISNLKPGIYKLGAMGQWVMSYIGDQGLTVNWGFTQHAPPVAVATLGTAVDNSATSASAAKISPVRTNTGSSGNGSGANKN